ncbi:MAG: hypothetical protein NT022_11210 [Deltaproteobacteria bacterium]|nr:hypothetical protein [Deltaproteobacteria bacterium]
MPRKPRGEKQTYVKSTLFDDVKKKTKPSLEIDTDQLLLFMRMKPTLEDTAAFFGTSHRTIERIIKRNWGLGFVQFREQHAVKTRYDLIRKALIESMKTPVNTQVLIFALKNLAGWSDKSIQEIKAELDLQSAPIINLGILKREPNQTDD